MTSYRRRLGNLSLKRKALVIFLLFVILPAFGVGVVVQYRYNQVLREQFINSTRRNLDNVTSQLSEQTKMVEDIADYLILSPDMRSYLRSSPPLESGQKEDLKNNIENFLTFQLMSKSYIRSIEISGYNGNQIRMGEPFTGDESRWESEAKLRKGGILWSEGHTLDSSWNGRVRIVSMVRILNSFIEITKPLGRLTIRLDEASLVSQLEQGVLEADAGSVYVVGPQGNLILSSTNRLPGGYVPDSALLSKLAGAKDHFLSYKVHGEHYLTLYNQMDNTGWKIIAMISESSIAGQFRGVQAIMAIILTAILVLALVALYGFNYTIIRPILRLKKETGRVAGGDFSARVPVESKDEIAELNRKFNEMVTTIQELIEHKYKLELRERETELKLMQNQMDPHFLYNTLDMIRWTARLEQADRTSRLIEMMSKFFRSAAGSKNYQTTLAKEMEFVQAYLYLQKYRLGDKLEYKLFLEPEIEGAPALKATIQPLVENFIKHGLDKSKPVYIVEVIGYVAENEIWIDVTDNGKGMLPEREREISDFLSEPQADRPHGRMGALYNIHERVTIFFGPQYGLKIIYSSAEGTGVRLRLPGPEAEG